MFLLLESIYLNEGLFRNLEYHENRMIKSCHDLFKKDLEVNLPALLLGSFPSKGLYKTRIIYNNRIQNIDFVPYGIQPIKSLKIINAEISYAYKFVDRSQLDFLYAQRGVADDVLIVKDGFITDTYYANVIFRKDNRWYTPQTCLLAGTMRQSLLDAGLIAEASIDITNYKQFQSVKLINSMLGMESSEIPITSIF